MKRLFLNLGLILGAALTFTNCTKELESPQAPEQMKGEDFEIFASVPQTKTINEGLATKWKLNDKLAVFYGAADATEYSAGQVYNCDDVASGHFKGNLDAAHALAESNDWYAFYSSAINAEGVLQGAFKTPMKSSWLTFGARTDYTTPQVQKQKGANSTAHIAGINYPLYGEAKAVAKGTSPAIELSHLSSLIKIQVKNESGEPLSVTDIEVETPSTTPIVGLFTYEVAPDKALLTPVSGNGKSGNPNSSNIARLEVTGAEVAAGASASFYLGTAPFVLEAGQALKIRVNGFEKSLKLAASAEFKSGAIKTLPMFAYTAKAPEMTAGTYVIAAKDENGDFYAMKNTPKSSRLDQLNLGQISDITATYEVLDNSILWNVVPATGGEGFAIKDQSGKFLSWDSTKTNNATTAAEELVLTGIGNPRGFFHIQFPEPAPSTIVRALAWNKTSIGFAFYDLATTTMDTEIYLIPAKQSEKQFLSAPQITVKATAAATAAENKIVVSWTDVANAGSYLVSCSGQTDQTVNPGMQSATFTGMSYGSYDVVVKAIPSDLTRFVEMESDITTVRLQDPNISLGIGDYVEISTAAEFTDGEYLFYAEKDGYANPGLMHNALVNSTIKNLKPVEITTQASQNFIKATAITVELQKQVIWTYNSTDFTLSSIADNKGKEETRYLTYQCKSTDTKGTTSVKVVASKSTTAAHNQWKASDNKDYGLVITSVNTAKEERSLCANFGGKAPNTGVAIGAYIVGKNYLPVRVFKKKTE